MWECSKQQRVTFDPVFKNAEKKRTKMFHLTGYLVC